MAGVLEGKVSIVTGGGTGIGKAIARALAAAGSAVTVIGPDLEFIDAVADEIGGMAVLGDVSREEDVAALMRACDEKHGRLDVLVNNAGITGPVSNVEDLDIKDWDQTLAVNARGVVLCIKHAVPLLKRQGGSIVNMSSLMGVRGYPMRSPYAASKFAVVAITQSVAQEIGPLGIRVNAICPGAVNGELMERVIASRAAKEGRPPEEIIKVNYTDVAALRKWVEPEEIANVAVFLASDAASAVTGELIKVDAGRM
jgi:NAD(P)-dependent dehydrogenase (short-subunit alcohol dehydrogenase family)